MCAVHGGADRSSRRDLPRKGSDMYARRPGHALELFVPALMLLRACAVHARCAHARRWHRMGDKCIPAAPNQLLTGILASFMPSLRLFRRNPADNATCAPRYTAAQPCRPAPRMPAHSQNLLIFSKSKTERSGTLERSLTFLSHCCQMTILPNDNTVPH